MKSEILAALYTIYAVSKWVIRIGAVFIVPRNRKPSSATAWLMIIFLFPTLGAVVFYLIGSPKLPKRRRAKQRAMSKQFRTAIKTHEALQHELVDPVVSERFKPLVDLNNHLGGLPVTAGNDVKLLPDYDDAIKRIAADVRAAKRSVSLEYFILVRDEATQVLFDALATAAKNGAKVRVLYDGIGSRGYPNKRSMKAMAQWLTDAGIENHISLPLKPFGKNATRPDLRNHRKIVVVDGEIAYTGSQNIVRRNYHRKDKLYYDELVARIQGPVAMEFQAVFMTDWYCETEEQLSLSTAPELFAPITKHGNTLAQALPSGPGFDNDNNLKLFTQLLHQAQRKVVITNPYWVPDDALATAITSAAQRGVDVTLINSEIMDQMLVGYAQRSYYEDLLAAGVKIYLYKPPVLLHAKHMSIDDDIAVIGSSNLDMRSFQLDLEVTLLAFDKDLVAAMRKIEAKYLAKSKLLNRKKWLARSTILKLRENVARLTSAIQ